MNTAGRSGPDDDAVVARRAQLRRVVNVTKRVGYTALLAAIVAFAIGVATDFASWTVTIAVAGLIASCVILPIPIVLAYGIGKAEREDPLRPPG